MRSPPWSSPTNSTVPDRSCSARTSCTGNGVASAISPPTRGWRSTARGRSSPTPRSCSRSRTSRGPGAWCIPSTEVEASARRCWTGSWNEPLNWRPSHLRSGSAMRSTRRTRPPRRCSAHEGSGRSTTSGTCRSTWSNRRAGSVARGDRDRRHRAGSRSRDDPRVAGGGVRRRPEPPSRVVRSMGRGGDEHPRLRPDALAARARCRGAGRRRSPGARRRTAAGWTTSRSRRPIADAGSARRSCVARSRCSRIATSDACLVSVDAQNPTGATAVYERVGMRSSRGTSGSPPAARIRTLEVRG